ncbi:hypothetical protein [Cellulophaga sp. Hel_I_12]|uniref:hypothetical protein n=1 Tax=Cellulophaga sp. Hel_I_12 TaxID=1249972 RepID=UPI000645D17E|nr:hypothetical protein [Cellulophaga sp. Hel_I_12]
MRFLSLLYFLLLFQGVFAQEIPKTTVIKIESKTNTNEKIDLKLLPEKKNQLSLKMPDLLGRTTEADMKGDNKPKVSMLPNTDLKQAGYDLVLDPKIREKRDSKSGGYFPNMYLGDIKNNGKFIGIVCRDHEYVDGDLVKITVNGVEVEPKLFLTGAFKGVNVDLQQGFNRIEFEALNEGSSSPNTAQVNVYDDVGKLIYANQWNLSTGSKATFVVVKE